MGTGRSEGRPGSRALRPSPERRLWFGLLAAPAAWTLHETAGYVIVARGCALGGGELPAWAIAAVGGLSLLAAGVAAAGGVVAHGVFRKHTGSVPVTRTDGWGRVEIMAAAGVFVSAALLLNILMFGVLPFLLEPCAATR